MNSASSVSPNRIGSPGLVRLAEEWLEVPEVEEEYVRGKGVQASSLLEAESFGE